jgi:hypothetical protein
MLTWTTTPLQRTAMTDSKTIIFPEVQDLAALVIELQSRIKALELAQRIAEFEPPTNCRQRLQRNGMPYPKSGCDACGSMSPKWRQCDAALDRLIGAEARPAGLVERVAGQIGMLAGFDNWMPEARAAIREVAAAALQMHPDKSLTWERVALWLEQEADRG